MMVYFTSPENQDLFSRFESESGQLVKKMVGKFSFETFRKTDMRKFDNYYFVAVDLSVLKDSSEAFLEAVKLFKLQFKPRLIFVAGADDQTICDSLRAQENYNIIDLSDDELEVQAQIGECLSVDGMKKPVSKEIVSTDEPSVILLKSKYQMIAVAGTQPRAGVTTAAMQLVHAMSSSGIRAAYIEANDSNHLSLIMQQTANAKAVTAGWEYNGGLYIPNGGDFDDTDIDAAVYDIGVLSQENVSGFKQMDTAVLIGGGNPHELAHVHSALEHLHNTSVQLLLHNVSDSVKGKLSFLLSNKNCDVHFLSVTDGMFDSEANLIVWRAVLGGECDEKAG